MTEQNKPMEKSNNKNKSIFRELTAEDPDQETTIIESLCMNCGENVRIYLNQYFCLYLEILVY